MVNCNIGDTVVCINTFGSCGWLTLYKEYTVTDVVINKRGVINFIGIKGERYGEILWNKSLFITLSDYRLLKLKELFEYA